jgi:hypothetical protein
MQGAFCKGACAKQYLCILTIIVVPLQPWPQSRSQGWVSVHWATQWTHENGQLLHQLYAFLFGQQGQCQGFPYLTTDPLHGTHACFLLGLAS